jgi:hypothetical protein
LRKAEIFRRRAKGDFCPRITTQITTSYHQKTILKRHFSQHTLQKSPAKQRKAPDHAGAKFF